MFDFVCDSHNIMQIKCECTMIMQICKKRYNFFSKKIKLFFRWVINATKKNYICSDYLKSLSERPRKVSTQRNPT